MLQYPNLHISLRSTLAGLTVRIDKKGLYGATVKRWRLNSRKVLLLAATLVIIGAGSFLGAYAFHLFGSDPELLDPSPRCAQYGDLYSRNGEPGRERGVQWKRLSSGSLASHERHTRTERYHPRRQ